MRLAEVSESLPDCKKYMMEGEGLNVEAGWLHEDREYDCLQSVIWKLEEITPLEEGHIQSDATQRSKVK